MSETPVRLLRVLDAYANVSSLGLLGRHDTQRNTGADVVHPRSASRLLL